MLFENAIPQLTSLSPSVAEVEEYLQKVKNLPQMPTFLYMDESMQDLCGEFPLLWEWALSTASGLGCLEYNKVLNIFLELVLVVAKSKSLSHRAFLIWKGGEAYDCAKGSLVRVCSPKYYILAVGHKVRQDVEEAQKAFIELVEVKNCPIDRGRILGSDPLGKEKGKVCLYTFIPYKGSVD